MNSCMYECVMDKKLCDQKREEKEKQSHKFTFNYSDTGLKSMQKIIREMH